MGLILIGANNPENYELAREWNINKYFGCEPVIGFIDNDTNLIGKTVGRGGFKVLGGIGVIPAYADNHQFVNLVTGSIQKREGLRLDIKKSFPNIKVSWGNFVHSEIPAEIYAHSNGLYIQKHVIVQAGVFMGGHVSIHTGAIVAHECIIGFESFIAHGACLSGKVKVGKGVFIGANATILPRLTIGDYAVIGAGAVVTKDVPEGVTVAGNPARVIRTADKSTKETK